MDDLSVPYDDPAHPERLILLGMSLERRILVVVFAERCGGDIVRIISARRATSHEREHYEVDE